MISGADKEITIFSKEGKLFQIDLEYAFNAVKNYGFTSIGVRGKDSVVVITQKKIPDKSIVASSVSHIFKITEKIGALFTGSLRKIFKKNLLIRMRQFAGDYRYEYGYDIPINVLGDKVSEVAQMYTQHAYMRPLCVVTMLFTIDDEKGPQLFKIDPAGHFVGYKATGAGEKEQSATNQLEREYKKRSDFSTDEAIRTAIKALQTTLSTEFRNTDIEIALVSVESPEVHVLNLDEVERELSKVGESD